MRPMAPHALTPRFNSYIAAQNVESSLLWSKDFTVVWTSSSPKPSSSGSHIYKARTKQSRFEGGGLTMEDLSESEVFQKKTVLVKISARATELNL